ncbi:MAG: helix-turn-helix domain-containing protein [Oscillospiraceae bacterium]|nr:helix-turn-helix domain-containing protein [Oscillospiraceae bacterium]
MYARKACDLTQQELADETGVSLKMIQGIENGNVNPCVSTAVRCAAGKVDHERSTFLRPNRKVLKEHHEFRIMVDKSILGGTVGGEFIKLHIKQRKGGKVAIGKGFCSLRLTLTL